MIRVLLVVLLTSISLPVFAQQWTTVFTNGFTTFLLDLSSIKKNGSTRTFWMVMNYPPNTFFDGSLSQRSKEVIDCDKETVQVLTRTNFSQASASGFPISTIDPPLKWEHIAPGSPIATVMKAVCK